MKLNLWVFFHGKFVCYMLFVALLQLEKYSSVEKYCMAKV